jgi:Zn finger protein HypA/HybF involved in hydrogenase expression
MSIITNLEKEVFENLIKESNTWTEVMCYFRDNYSYKNIASNGTAKKRCLKENISFSHFNNGRVKVELAKTNKAYSSRDLKKRLFKEGKLEEKCSKCGLGPVWQNNPISLQLEHINGDHYDNTLENLTILCPNCHSQTSTWCGKGPNILCKCLVCDKTIKRGYVRCQSCAARKRHADEKNEVSEAEIQLEVEQEIDREKKKCIDCQKNITKESTRCPSCASIQSNIPNRKVAIRPTLEQLVQDIAELKYMTRVGLKYGVSDGAVRKWIKLYEKQIVNS